MHLLRKITYGKFSEIIQEKKVHIEVVSHHAVMAAINPNMYIRKKHINKARNDEKQRLYSSQHSVAKCKIFVQFLL